MSKWFSALSLLFILLLSGCSKLTQYTLTEQDINRQLHQRIHFARDIGMPGVASAHITLTDLQSQIGRADPNKINLTGNAQLNLNSLFGNQQATLTVTLTTRPYFDQQQGAIYLRDLQITDTQASQGKIDFVLHILLPHLNQSLSQYFDQHPVYILDAAHSNAQALVKKYAKSLEVRSGELVIHLL